MAAIEQIANNEAGSSVRTKLNLAITEANKVDGKAAADHNHDSAYAPALGADDNYVTDAEKTKLSNLSGTNTGDQTLPVKATGSDINTGTDDDKFATAKAITDSDLGKKLVGINEQSGTTYTLALTDAGKLVRISNANSITLTIPKNSSVAFATGTRILVEQQGAGVITVAPVDGDVTINSTAKKTWGQYSVIELVKLNTNLWNVIGGSV